MNLKPLALSFEESLILANTLAESPETIIPLFQIKRSLAKTYISGSKYQPDAIIIQAILDPGESTTFGKSAKSVWEVLKTLKRWRCINLDQTTAIPLQKIMERELKVPIRYYEEVYHTIEEEVISFYHPNVRIHSIDDSDLIKEAKSELKDYGKENLIYEMRHGFVAGGIIDEKLVVIAHNSARTKNYADIGVYTSPFARKQGLSTACSSLVAQLIKAKNQIPTWSTGEDNFASIRVAKKIGFKEVARRAYLILPK